MSNINDFKLTENFRLYEFECTHQDHRHVKLSKNLVIKLQELRYELSRPMIITSGYRCEERNRQVNGSPNSQHLRGTAADISIRNQSKSIEEIAELAKDIGFTGIGYYNTLIHLDVRKLPKHITQKVITWDQR